MKNPKKNNSKSLSFEIISISSIEQFQKNSTNNSSIINSFSQLKNFSSPKSSRNTINNLKKTIPKRNIK